MTLWRGGARRLSWQRLSASQAFLRSCATAREAASETSSTASTANVDRGIDFRTLADTFAAIEQARGSRGACVSLLATTLRALHEQGRTRDLAAALFLTASQLAPAHEGVELRFGARSFAPVLQRLLLAHDRDAPEAVAWDTLLPSLPDYGAAIPFLLSTNLLSFPLQPDLQQGRSREHMAIADVRDALLALAQEQGTGSLARKQDRAVALLLRCGSENELVYLVRLLAHQKLRIGMGDKSILAALASATASPPRDPTTVPTTKSSRKTWSEAVTHAYAQLPDFAALATLVASTKSVSTDGKEEEESRSTALLAAAAPRAGTPVLTMAAYPITSVGEALRRAGRNGGRDGDEEQPATATCEFKYDGARVQLHLAWADGTRVVGRVFSRNMEDQTDKYGALLDVVEAQLRRSPDEAEKEDDKITDVVSMPQSLILEGELVAVDRRSGAFLPFQVLQTKPTAESAATTALCLFAFDLLAWAGINLMRLPLMDRRAKLRAILAPRAGELEFVRHLDITLDHRDTQDGQASDGDGDGNGDVEADTERLVRGFLQEAVNAGCEGLMVKTLAHNAEYRAGMRSFSWMKLKHDYLRDDDPPSTSTSSSSSSTSISSIKKQAHTETGTGVFLPDTLDLVPIAAFHGKGRRAGVFGSFLLAVYDTEAGRFEAIGKVGTGFSDAQLHALSAQLRSTVVASDAALAAEMSELKMAVDMACRHRPDVWLAPSVVWEIRATQLTQSPLYTAGHAYLPGGTSGDRNGDKADERKTPSSAGLALRFPRFVRPRPEKAPQQATDSALIAQWFQDQSGGNSDKNSDNER